MATSPLTYSLESTTAVLHMDDGKANALSDVMIDALLEGLARAQKEATAVVLVGRKDKFCAGFDLKVMLSSPENAKTLLRRGSDLLMKLYGSEIPLVVACTGHALAGGALVLLTGDVRIGTEGAYRIGLNEVSIGMPIPILAMELARDRLDVRELAHATLMSKIYAPAEAVSAGYLDKIAPEAEVLGLAMEEAKRLGALTKTAYSSTKDRLRGKTIQMIRDTLDEDMKALLMPVGKS